MAQRVDEVEVLAIWLCGAALQREDGFTILRDIVRQAAVDAEDMYSAPNEEENLDIHDPLEVRKIIAGFAAKLDEMKRQREEDE